MPRQPIPSTPIISPPLAPRRSQRVIPSQVPSPRVTPIMNPNDGASPRVTTELPLTDFVPPTPHPDSDNAPYMPQGMAGMNLFDTFEEEHMETPAVPRYNTRARSRQHSVNQSHTLTPRIVRPIAFTNKQTITLPFKQTTQTMPMSNLVINEDTGASLEYHNSSKMTVHFPSVTMQQQINLDDWHKILEA
jgi:hypothetical protein